MSVYIPEHLNKVRDVNITAEELIKFEDKVASVYEDGKIRGPIRS